MQSHNLQYNMDVDTASKFIASLTKSLQAIIHGCLDFEKNIELGGYVYLRVDNAQRVDYVLSEKMQKSDLNSLTFHSNSFHALPALDADQTKFPQDRENGSTHVAESAEKAASIERSHSKPPEAQIARFSTSHSSSRSPQQNSSSGTARKSDSVPQAQVPDDSIELQASQSSFDWPALVSPAKPSRSSDRTQSLTDFKTAFQNLPKSLTSQTQPSSSSTHCLNGSSSSFPSSHPQNLHHHQQQQQQQMGKSGVLPDVNEMEVVHIKTEEGDDVFSVPMPCQQSGTEIDGLTAQDKVPWLAMRMRHPIYFPYPRLARSQSWDRRMSMAASGPKFPFFPAESSSDALSMTCKICGKSYRSRQGLLFHERAKHQNVFNVYCPVCGKGFQQTTHMYGHMATHTNVKNFQCQACGTKYAHKTSLQQHLRSGSCRSLQTGNSTGLDLSTSQILREYSPFSLNETQSRHSSSQSQSPQETEFGQSHAEDETTLNQQSSGLPRTALSSPNETLNSDEKRGRFSDQTAELNRRCESQEMSQIQASGDEVMNLKKASGSQVTDQTLRGDQLTRPEMSGDQITGLHRTNRETIAQNRTSGNHTGSLNTADKNHSMMGDLIKHPQAVDINSYYHVHSHDPDVSETVSLSLSADDD